MQESVEAAEEVTASYVWNPDLTVSFLRGQTDYYMPQPYGRGEVQ